MQSLLLLKGSQKKIVEAVRETMKAEDHQPVSSANQARKLVEKDPDLATLFLVSKHEEWLVIATYAEEFPLGLASAIAEKSDLSGWFVEPSARNHVSIWKVERGQHQDEPQDLTLAKATALLAKDNVPEALMSFKVKTHLGREEIKHGNHQDILLGFISKSQKQSEVTRALGKPVARGVEALSLDDFLERAVGHERVRAIAKAQVLEQLKRDGISTELTISNPQAEGHHCEAFDAESYSFTSSGPYVWFDWFCEEACEPRLPEEHTFPACDLRFSLQKASEL